MEHFVTLFDSAFLPQGLALHESLLQHCDCFTLWILCLDSGVERKLTHLNLANVRLLSLENLETASLSSLKSERSRAEYCWTLTPWSVFWVFESDPGVARVTYIDADLYFVASPVGIFEEFSASGKSVLITEHGYSPECDQTLLAGRYCVQFLTFVRGQGQVVLQWWLEQCMNWCFDRYEDGLFGDQRYLEKFNLYFPDTIFCTGPDCRFQAPWNASIYRLSEAVVYHFHGLRLLGGHMCLLSDYRLPEVLLLQRYLPYLKLIYNLSDKYGLQTLPQAARLGYFYRLKLWLVKKLAYKLLRYRFPPFFAERRSTKLLLW